jgi:hypothetical protein
MSHGHVPDVLIVVNLPVVASLVLMAFLLLLSSLPAVDGVLAVAGGLAIASIPADPGVPILAGVFTYCTVQCALYNEHNKGYRIIGLWLSNCYFFCYRTIGISISDWQIL